MRRRLVALVLLVCASAAPLPAGAARADTTRLGDIDDPRPVPIVYVHGWNSSGCVWDKESSIRYYLHRDAEQVHDVVVNYGLGDCEGGVGTANPPEEGFMQTATRWVKRGAAGAIRWAVSRVDSATRIAAVDPSEGDFTDPRIWRKVEAAVLAAHAQSATGYVDIVAHSMGGLVSRWYLNQPDARGREYVRNLVMIGTPNHGSFGSLGTRLLGLWRYPDWYDLDSERVRHWGQLYTEYQAGLSRYWAAGSFGLRGQYPGFFDWLAAQRPADLAVFKDPAPRPARAKNAQAQQRYSGQFEEFLALVLGKAKVGLALNLAEAGVGVAIPVAALGNAHSTPTDQNRTDQTPQLDTPSVLRSALSYAGERVFDYDPKGIAMDRLLPDHISIPVGVGENGRVRPIDLPVNPILIDLNGRDQENRGLTRYIGIAGTTDDRKSGFTTWVSGGLGSHPIQANDTVVEWTSVALARRGSDRFYRFDLGDWGNQHPDTLHSGLTYLVDDVKQQVRADLANYFGQKRAAVGPLRLNQSLRERPLLPPGQAVLLSVQPGKPEPVATRQDPDPDLHLVVTGPAGSAGASLFTEYEDGRIEITPLSAEQAVPVRGVHRLAVLRPFSTAESPEGRPQLNLELTFRPAGIRVTGLATTFFNYEGVSVLSLATKSDGTVWAWGGSYLLEDMVGATNSRNRDFDPVQVPGLTDVVALAPGLALKSDGTVWKWGSYRRFDLDGNPRAVRGPERVSGLADVVALASGLALKSDGTVWQWRSDTPVPVAGLADVVALAGGLALKSDGTVWQWRSGTPVPVAGLADVVALASGLAVKKDGTVWAWGDNYYGQLGDGTTQRRDTPVKVSGLAGVAAVAAGSGHSLAVKKDGTVWAWGSNVSGELGDGTTQNRRTPVPVSGLTDVVAVAAGYHHSLALKSDGSVWMWGYNERELRPLPVQVLFPPAP